MQGLLASLALVQIFVGDEAAAISWNFPSWSIAAEVWTYLLFAVLLKTKLSLRWLAPIGAAALIYLLLTAGERYLNDIHDGALARCILGFSLGALVCSVRGRRTIQGFATALEVMTAVIVVLGVYVFGGTVWEFLMPFIFAGAIWVFSHEQGPISRILKTRPLLLLGTLSYSIYMIHAFVGRRLANLIGISFPGLLHGERGALLIGDSPVTGDLMSLIFLALVIGCAWCTYRLIEQPGREWSRRRVLREGDERPSASRADAAAF